MPLRIGVVGAGHMGLIHIDKLRGLPGVELAGVADVDAARFERLPDKKAIPFVIDYRVLPRQLDGVVIATPTDTHFSVAGFFLERGVNVFIEKPISRTPEEGQELIRIAGERGLLLQIGHSERFNPSFSALLSETRQPRLIQASRRGPFTGRSTDIDVIHDLMIHDLDLILTLIGDEVVDVKARGIALATDKVDMAEAWILFRGGCAASLTASRIAVDRERYLTAYETDRVLHADFLAGKVTVATLTGSGPFETRETMSPKMDPVRDELAQFVRAIEGNGTPAVSGEDGVKALSLADRIAAHITTPSP